MATFTVTTAADTTVDDGQLSLREALAQADAAPGADTVAFDLAAMGGNRIVLAGSELTASSDVTIDGGTGVVIDANQESRVLAVQGSASNVVLDHLTITGGKAENGAGIQAGTGSDLTLVDSTVTRNTSTFGDGAGINAEIVTLSGSTISSNTGASDGGGIFALKLTASNSTIANNDAVDEGGGIYAGGEIRLTACTVAFNTASQGGGVFIDTIDQPFGTSFANNIISGNRGSTGLDLAGRFNSNGKNIFGSDVGSNVGDLEGIGPAALFSGGLADNGGPTETIALLASAANPAIARGANTALTSDQRGEPRPAPGQSAPDVGAFELQARPTIVPGGADDDHLAGTGGSDLLLGRVGDDRLHGLSGGDRLIGGNGRDALIGGKAADLLIGGSGADRFVIGAGHSAPGAEDFILDFSRRQGDRIDLRRLDGDPDRAGDQKLEFVGTHRFDGAGQVRIDDSGGYTRIEVNLDADRHAEVSLRLDREVRLQGDDFLL